MKKLLWTASLLILLLTAGAIAAKSSSSNTDTEITAKDASDIERETTAEASELNIHFIDVGQGDSTLIICNNEAMLIDAGNNAQGTKVQNYIQKQGVNKLKYVICTHPDADHIGGIDVILYKFDCETVFMTEEQRATDTYRDVTAAMNTKGYTATMPIVGNTYPLGDAEFTIIGPAAIGDDSNNNSIAIVLSHGKNKFVFTGDAEESEEQEIINSGISIDADVYKTGHHGSKSSSSKELLDAVSPAYAVISCAADNAYGHPHAQTLNNLRAMGIAVFRTDEQGSIIATSNGTEIVWNCSPSETWLSGEAAAASVINTEKTEASVEEAAPITYICNTNTKKFHYPGCSSVNQMKEANKLPVASTREELIAQGYTPCKNCNP